MFTTKGYGRSNTSGAIQFMLPKKNYGKVKKELTKISWNLSSITHVKLNITEFKELD